MENNEKPGDNAAPSTEEPAFGAWLREQREKKKISLEEIAAVTKVHISQLQNIENGKNADLPASAFVRGFLINYARHIGMEESEVLRRYRQSLAPDIQKELGVARNSKAAQAPTNPKVKVVHTPSFQNAPGAKGVEEEPSKWLRPRVLLIGAVVLTLIATIAILVSLGKEARRKAQAETEGVKTDEVATTAPAPTSPAMAPPANPSPAAPTAALPATGTAAATTAAKAPSAATATNPAGVVDVAAPKHQVELRALETTWLSVRVDESSWQSMTLRAGAPFTTGIQRRAQINFSNAGVVEIKWDGTWYESPGFRGDVKSLVLPDQLGELKVRTAPVVIRPRPKPVAPAAPAPTTDTE